MANYPLAGYPSPNAGVQVSLAGADQSTTASLGKAIQNIDSNRYYVLGYGVATSGQTISSTSTPGTDITSCTTTVTADGVHDVKITVSIPNVLLSSGSTKNGIIAIQKDGSVIAQGAILISGIYDHLTYVYIDLAPLVGSHTYKLSAWSDTAGNWTTMAITPNQNLILVEQLA